MTIISNKLLIEQLSKLKDSEAQNLLQKAFDKRKKDTQLSLKSVSKKEIGDLKKEFKELNSFTYEGDFTISGNIKVDFVLDDFGDEWYPYMSEQIAVTFSKNGRRSSLQKFLEESFKDILENNDEIADQTPFDNALSKNKKKLKKLLDKIAALSEKLGVERWEIEDQVIFAD